MIHRVLSRRRARGAAVLLVVLALAALAGVAAFAARASTLSIASSGHARQAAQTQYLTEYAVQAALAELSTPRGPAYVQRARIEPANDCTGGGDCFVFSREQLELAGAPLLDPAAPPLPGSLGWADLDWACKVELTDLIEAMPPPPGQDETSAGAVNVRPVMVTLSATGVVWPRVPAGPAQAEVIAGAASQSILSAQVIVSNVPRM